MIGTMASANIGATPARRSERKPDHMPLPLYAIFLAGKLTGRFLNSVSPEQELLVKLNHPGRCDTQMSCDASCARNVPPVGRNRGKLRTVHAHRAGFPL